MAGQGRACGERGYSSPGFTLSYFSWGSLGHTEFNTKPGVTLVFYALTFHFSSLFFSNLAILLFIYLFAYVCIVHVQKSQGNYQK